MELEDLTAIVDFQISSLEWPIFTDDLSDAVSHNPPAQPQRPLAGWNLGQSHELTGIKTPSKNQSTRKNRCTKVDVAKHPVHLQKQHEIYPNESSLRLTL